MGVPPEPFPCKNLKKELYTYNLCSLQKLHFVVSTKWKEESSNLFTGRISLLNIFLRAQHILFTHCMDEIVASELPKQRLGFQTKMAPKDDTLAAIKAIA